eukprot:jgi/Bigna1/81883/fgenesh1_pg.85_\
MIRQMKRQFRDLLTSIGFLKRAGGARRKKGGGGGGEEGSGSSNKAETARKTRVLWEERRIDVSDGNAYTKDSFMEVYGGLKEWDTAKVGTPLERRIDPADGKAYTRKDFIDCYGGLKEWKRAGGEDQSAQKREKLMKSRARAALAEAEAFEHANAMDENKDNLRLLRAVLVAGLYPNVVRIQAPDKDKSKDNSSSSSRKPQEGRGGGDSKVEVKFFARNGAVDVHPASVLWGESTFRYPFLIYHEKVKTSKVYLRDATMITPYSLLLFGGNIMVSHAEGSVTVDSWIKFNVPPAHAVLIHKLRLEIASLLQRKIEDPAFNASDVKSTKVIQAVSQLMKSE